MAWLAGPIMLAPGATVTISWVFPGGSWQGPQFMLARPSVGLIGITQWLETEAQGVMHVARFNPDGRTVTDTWIYTQTVKEMIGRQTIGFVEGGSV
jgi:hypothetical protein